MVLTLLSCFAQFSVPLLIFFLFFCLSFPLVRGTLCAYARVFNIVSALVKLSKRCEHGAILQFEGMFCLGVAGADQLPYKMDLLLRCYNGLNYEWIISQWKCHANCQSGRRRYHRTET